MRVIRFRVWAAVALSKVSRLVCWCILAPSGSGRPIDPKCGICAVRCSRGRLLRARGNACFFPELLTTPNNRPAENERFNFEQTENEKSFLRLFRCRVLGSRRRGRAG